jgi:RHS repeat-associated protein
VTSAPYTLAWSNPPAGSYSVTAKATDDKGKVTTSAGRSITVKTGPPAIELITPTNGQTYTAPASVTLTANATPAAGTTLSRVEYYRGSTRIGSATTAPYTVTWSNAGAGNYSVTAKATDNKGGTSTSPARSITVNANQTPAVELTSPANGQTFAAPATITLTANATDSDGTITKVEYYRSSTRIGTASSPPYTVTWANAGTGTYSLTAKATDDKGKVTTSVARTITVNANQAPAVELTSPANGQTFAAPATITLTANASDSDGTITKVDFYRGTTLIGTKTTAPYSVTWTDAPAGTYSLTAKATDDKGSVTTSSARSITVKANQAPTVELTSPANGQTFNAPATITLTANASDTDGTIAKVEFYRGATLIGTKTAAPYTVTWTDAPAGTYSLTAKATDDKGAVTTSSARSITVTAAPPTISLTSPTEGQSFTAPASISLAVSVTAGSGTITKVEYFRGATLIGTVTAAPYSYTWTDVPVGNYTLTAKATNSNGGATTSTARTVTVNANQAPTVALTAPTEGQTFTAPATVTLTANATDSDGTIARVEFYRGTTLIGTKTSAPYTVTWTNAPAGTYSLTAKATDDKGAVTTSSARSITVTAVPPTISLTSPTDGQSFTAPASMTLAVSVTPGSGTLTKVEYFRGSTLIGTVTTAPYSYSWTDVPAGSYTLTAKATNSNNGVTTSTARTITVNANQAPTVALTAPTDGQTFTAPATITLTANASDSDGTIAKVEFYRGATLIGTRTTSPYSVTWSDAPAGSYTLTAKATDDKGAVTTSAARTITVEGTAVSGNVYYIHSDHLETPREITNEQNQTVWKNPPLTEPFGSTPVDDDPDGDGQAFTFNLRFPGQYYDRETGTHYNYFRDNYLPDFGRYGQSDPIGLAGGINTYGYVRGNPLGEVDPLGLCACPGGIWKQLVGDFGVSVAAGGFFSITKVHYICQSKPGVTVTGTQICFGGGPIVALGAGWNFSGRTYGAPDSSDLGGWSKHQGQFSFGPFGVQAPVDGNPGGSASVGKSIGGGAAYTSCYLIIWETTCPECDK